jgi:hypothetical protein
LVQLLPVSQLCSHFRRGEKLIIHNDHFSREVSVCSTLFFAQSSKGNSGNRKERLQKVESHGEEEI